MNDPYFDTQTCCERLFNTWSKYGKLIVAFDFDDTIYDYHKKGHRYSRVINLLQRCSDLGFTMILFSCKETSAELNNCADHCQIMGINVDYMNYSPILGLSRKPFYSILLDDRAGLGQAYQILFEVVNRIEKETK